MIKRQRRRSFDVCFYYGKNGRVKERLFKIRPSTIQRGLIAVWIVLSIVSIAHSSLAVTDLSAYQRRQLEKGEVLTAVKPKGNPPKGMVEAAILIEAPAESIWRVMIDCAAAPSFVPGVNACRVTSAGDDWEIIEHDVKWTWFFPEITYAFRADYRKNERIDFVRTGGDLRDMAGHWSLHPLDSGNRTMVCYSVYLDPGFLVPQWLVRHSLKKDLPAVLRALREHVLHNTGKQPKYPTGHK